MKILAIETSCDDSGIAILEDNQSDQPKILANLVSSQIKIHAPWGGVVPTLAKREHQHNLVPLLKKALSKTDLLHPALSTICHSEGVKRPKNLSRLTAVKREPEDSSATPQNDTLSSILEREPELAKKLLPFLKKYQKPAIDALAVTIGPGLEPALWVGVNFARALASFWNLPIIPVNHVEGHITAAFFHVIATPQQLRGKQSRYDTVIYEIAASPRSCGTPRNDILPAIALVVSGGHTTLFFIKKFGRYETVGETRDDAAGEAFDKAAKMLGLGYPGGPAISKIAAQFNPQLKTKNYQLKTTLPRPMLNSGDFDFSFSGLKTALLYRLQKMTEPEIKKMTPFLCAEFQQATVDVLVAKTIKAAKKFKAKTVILAGGVAANHSLRQVLAEKLKEEKPEISFLFPEAEFCTDNAAMIGLAALKKIHKKSSFKNWRALRAQANLRL